MIILEQIGIGYSILIFTAGIYLSLVLSSKLLLFIKSNKNNKLDISKRWKSKLYTLQHLIIKIKSDNITCLDLNLSVLNNFIKWPIHRLTKNKADSLSIWKQHYLKEEKKCLLTPARFTFSTLILPPIYLVIAFLFNLPKEILNLFGFMLFLIILLATMTDRRLKILSEVIFLGRKS